MKKGEKAKLELLEAAVELIAERGDTEFVDLYEIAERVGVPVSRLIYYYQTRSNFLVELGRYVISKNDPTPISTYLEEHRQMLTTREGQVLFVNALFCHFREFFLAVPVDQLNYCKTFRALLHSREIPEIVCRVPHFYLKDFAAFSEIYNAVTGKDDKEQAAFWYTSVIDVLADRLSSRNKADRLDDEHVFAPDFDLKFLNYCRKRLMMGLGLWETPNGLQ